MKQLSRNWTELRSGGRSASPQPPSNRKRWKRHEISRRISRRGPGDRKSSPKSWRIVTRHVPGYLGWKSAAGKLTASSSTASTISLPDEVELVHSPGLPRLRHVAGDDRQGPRHRAAVYVDVIFCSFGDMLRVPGSEFDLLVLKSRGADVRVVYSPLDCLKIARANPDKKVVFFAIGFETTAPGNAMAVWQAHKRGASKISRCTGLPCPRAASGLHGLDSSVAAQSCAGLSSGRAMFAR